MPTPNKYHGSGRLYTAKEYRDRKHAMRPTYLVAGYSPDPLQAAQQRLTGDCKPYIKGRNKRKRAARLAGFKSLAQRDRLADILGG